MDGRGGQSVHRGSTYTTAHLQSGTVVYNDHDDDDDDSDSFNLLLLWDTGV